MISVAMTTFNGEKYISRQLDSIFNQSMKVDEIIVCDDGSTDRTLEILKKYPVKVYLNETRLGYKLNFKKAIHLCKGNYVFLCDQDDIWEVNKVETMVQCIKKNPNIHVLSSAFRYIDDKDDFMNIAKTSLYAKKVRENALYPVGFDEYYSMNYFQGCSLVLDRWILNKTLSFYDGSLPHDWYFCMAASLYQGMYFLNVPLFRYRLHDKNTIGVKTVTQSSFDHLEQANTLAIRQQNAIDALCVLNFAEQIHPEFYKKNQTYYEGFKKFLINHNMYLESKNFLGLLKQNVSPYYKCLKTKKARIMDLLFVLK